MRRGRKEGRGKEREREGREEKGKEGRKKKKGKFTLLQQPQHHKLHHLH